MPVPIELWALSVIATPILLKSFHAGNYAKNLGSFKMQQAAKQEQQNSKAKQETPTNKNKHRGS